MDDNKSQESKFNTDMGNKSNYMPDEENSFTSNLDCSKDIEFNSVVMNMNEIESNTDFERIINNTDLIVNNVNEDALNNTTASTNVTDMFSDTLTTVTAQKSLNELNHTESESSLNFSDESYVQGNVNIHKLSTFVTCTIRIPAADSDLNLTSHQELEEANKSFDRNSSNIEQNMDVFNNDPPSIQGVKPSEETKKTPEATDQTIKNTEIETISSNLLHQNENNHSDESNEKTCKTNDETEELNKVSYKPDSLSLLPPPPQSHIQPGQKLPLVSGITIKRISRNSFLPEMAISTDSSEEISKIDQEMSAESFTSAESIPNIPDELVSSECLLKPNKTQQATNPDTIIIHTEIKEIKTVRITTTTHFYRTLNVKTNAEVDIRIEGPIVEKEEIIDSKKDIYKHEPSEENKMNKENISIHSSRANRNPFVSSSENLESKRKNVKRKNSESHNKPSSSKRVKNSESDDQPIILIDSDEPVSNKKFNKTKKKNKTKMPIALKINPAQKRSNGDDRNSEKTIEDLKTPTIHSTNSDEARITRSAGKLNSIMYTPQHKKERTYSDRSSDTSSSHGAKKPRDLFSVSSTFSSALSLSPSESESITESKVVKNFTFSANPSTSKTNSSSKHSTKFDFSKIKIDLEPKEDPTSSPNQISPKINQSNKTSLNLNRPEVHLKNLEIHLTPLTVDQINLSLLEKTYSSPIEEDDIDSKNTSLSTTPQTSLKPSCKTIPIEYQSLGIKECSVTMLRNNACRPT